MALEFSVQGSLDAGARRFSVPLCAVAVSHGEEGPKLLHRVVHGRTNANPLVINVA